MPSASGDSKGDYVVSPRAEDGVRKKSDAATGASAAGIRAISAQLVAFYFRAPIKAFFRTRFDYSAYARAINPHFQANEKWSWRMSTPGVLAHAVKEYGWKFIPNQVLPPMLANITVGAILYTSYLQSLSALHEPASRQAKRIYPPPSISMTLAAGFAAGSIQSVVAAPFDALQTRFRTSDLLEGHYRNMWSYARHKLMEIGPRGVFAGWSLSFLKDSFGFACFFATFETVKAQAYYGFVRNWYANYRPILSDLSRFRIPEGNGQENPVIKPHYAMEPTFLLLAGVAASVTQQIIQHPISNIQNVHYERLESLDYAAKIDQPRGKMLRVYYHAYQETLEQCRRLAMKAGGWRTWLYKDLLWTTLRQTPSTSAGLIVFELIRRRYSTEEDVVRIRKDGYDILLS